MIRTRRLFGLLLAFAVVVSCNAQGGPPMRTDDPGTPGNGNWEINLAATTDRFPGEWSSDLPLLDINYGVGDRLQLKLELPWVRKGTNTNPSKTGLGNCLIGLKWRFFEHERLGLQISTYPQMELNTPTASVARGVVDARTRILVPTEIAKKLGPVEVNGEIGVSVRTGRPNPIAGFVVGHQVKPWLELMGEVYDSEGEKTFDIGSRVRITRRVTALLMSGRRFPGASSSQPQFIAYAGLQFTISRNHE